MTNYAEICLQAGLSKDQAAIYTTLLRHKHMQASMLSKLVGVERTLTYKNLDILIEMGLVGKHDEPKKVTVFWANHPEHFRDAFEAKRTAMEHAAQLMEKSYENMVTDYNIVQGKPNVRFFEGALGAEYITNDFHEAPKLGIKHVMLIRSHLDRNNPELYELFQQQIKKRVAKRITMDIVGPVPTVGVEKIADLTHAQIAELSKKDAKRLVRRRVIEDFFVPTQVMIYGNKVAITDYSDNVVTTLIESKTVRETYERIFKLLFAVGKELPQV